MSSWLRGLGIGWDLGEILTERLGKILSERLGKILSERLRFGERLSE